MLLSLVSVINELHRAIITCMLAFIKTELLREINNRNDNRNKEPVRQSQWTAVILVMIDLS